MNAIVGYEVVGEMKIPRFSGPCKGCGAENYGLSTSGPEYCGVCACGVNPELTKLRRAYGKLSADFIDQSMALGIVTGHFPPFNEHTTKRGQVWLDARKAEWESRNSKPSEDTSKNSQSRP